MVKEHNWVNTFFFILIVLMIVFFISWFFGIRIPNFQGLKTSITKAQIPTSINTNLKCDDVIYNDESHILYMKIWGDTEEIKNVFLETKCREVCSSKTIIGEDSILVTYKSHKCENDVLICGCDK